MNASEARKIAASYNRKKHKKYLVEQYKQIGKCIKKEAKKGRNYLDFTITKDRYEDGLKAIFKLFKYKNPSFNMTISESDYEYNIFVHIYIKW